MSGVARQIGRIWVTILVAYVLVANAVLPGYAMARLADLPPGLLCQPSLLEDGSEPGTLPGHDDACCILCAVAAAPALPAPPPAEPAAARAGVVEVVLRPASPAPPRGPPAARPQSPRAPPIAV